MKYLQKQMRELLDELLFHSDLCQQVLEGGDVRSLYSWMNGGKRYYAEYHNGRQKTLGQKNSYVEELQGRLCAKEVLKALDQDIALLDTFIRKWQPYDLDEIDGLPSGCIDLSPVTYAALGFIDPRAWITAPYQKKEDFPEGLIHETRSGRMVRSRAEVIIGDTYDDMRIPWHYEELYVLPNGVKWYPDFTILPFGKPKPHEHCGNLKDPGSLKRYLWKEQQCVMAGIQPGRDILFTFDGYEGELNTRYLRRSIEQFLENCD